MPQNLLCSQERRVIGCLNLKNVSVALLILISEHLQIKFVLNEAEKNSDVEATSL
jgi:hypothetical protein